MNAFELFDFEPALELNRSELDRRFEHLRTHFHPDRYAQASALERRIAVQRAADINAAHATLANPLSRAQHYFELRGITLNEAQTLQDAGFLMQQMELREALEEARDDQARHALNQQVNALWTQTWDALCAASSTDNVELIAQPLQRLQFLQRFIQQMNQT